MTKYFIKPWLVVKRQKIQQTSIIIIMLPLSIKKSLQESSLIRFFFWGTIFLFIAVIILSILSANLSCQYLKSYTFCTEVPQTTWGYECFIGDTAYCCNYFDYNSCGDYYCERLSSFDVYKPESCKGVQVALWVVSGVCLLTVTLLLITFCRYRCKPRGLLISKGPQIEKYGQRLSQNGVILTGVNRDGYQGFKQQQSCQLVSNSQVLKQQSKVKR